MTQIEKVKIVTASRAHKLDDYDWEYRMVYIERGGGITVTLPAGLYERMGKPRKVTVAVSVGDV